jgi:N-acetylneuraminate synthase
MRKEQKKAYIIGEVGLSHGGDMVRAMESIEECAWAICDAVKFQIRGLIPAHVNPDSEWRDRKCAHAKHYSRSQYLKNTMFNREQWKVLREYAKKCGVGFGASIWHPAAVVFANDWLSPDYWKIAAPQAYGLAVGTIKEIHELLPTYTDKPVFCTINEHLSTQQVQKLYKMLCHLKLTFLVSTDEYPTHAAAVGLNRMAWIRKEFDCPVGLSDHTGNPWAACIASYLGADAIETHMGVGDVSPDCRNSLSPEALIEYTEAIEYANLMKNNPVYPVEEI